MNYDELPLCPGGNRKKIDPRVTTVGIGFLYVLHPHENADDHVPCKVGLGSLPLATKKFLGIPAMAETGHCETGAPGWPNPDVYERWVANGEATGWSRVRR
jgi:hypothetical protein